MTRRLHNVVAAVAAVAFAAACGQDSPTSTPPTGPSFAKASAFACVFNGNPSLSSAINDFFKVAADKNTANAYGTAIQTAYNSAPSPNYAAAQGPGFDLLKFVGDVARSGRGASPATGEAVIEQTIQCINNVAAATGAGQAFEGWPTAAQFDFASALSFADGGAYFVRGDATKDAITAPVVAQLAGFTPVTDGNVSAIAPAANSDWPTSLGQRVLIYGNLFRTTPDAQPIGYDWKLIPRDATLTPNGVVALCNGLGIEFGNSDLINQVGLGVLAFQDAGGLCGSSVVALQGRSLLQRMKQLVMSAFSPDMAHATVFLTSTGGGLGGAKGDPFVAVPVTSLNVEWFKAPPAVMRLNQPVTAVGAAWTLVNDVKTYVNGACLFITGTNNNGTGTSLSGSKDCGQPTDIQVSSATTFKNPPNSSPGYSTFTITATKTGGLNLTLSAVSLVNRNSVVSNNTVVAKTNVKP